MSYFRTLSIVGLTYTVTSIFIFIMNSLVESEILLFFSYYVARGTAAADFFPVLATILCLSLIFATISRDKNLIKVTGFLSLLCSVLLLTSLFSPGAEGFGALIILTQGIIFGGVFLASSIFYAVMIFLEKKYGAATLVSPENIHSTWTVILYTVLGLSVVLYNITLQSSIRPLLLQIRDILFGPSTNIFFYLTLLIIPCLAYVFIRSIHMYIKSEETYKHYTLAYFSTIVMVYAVAFLPVAWF